MAGAACVVMRGSSRCGGSGRLEQPIACWTLVEDDWRLVGNKTGATRLGFAVLLKFFQLEARLPSGPGEVPPPMVGCLARQVGVEPALFAGNDWRGRAIKYHQAQVREALGFREPTVADEERLGAWLTEEVGPLELRDERLREARLGRLTASARATASVRAGLSPVDAQRRCVGER